MGTDGKHFGHCGLTVSKIVLGEKPFGHHDQSFMREELLVPWPLVGNTLATVAKVMGEEMLCIMLHVWTLVGVCLTCWKQLTWKL